MENLTCKNFGRQFETMIYWARFCSDGCRDHGHYVRKRDSGYFKRKGDEAGTPAGAVRAGNWKLIEYFEDGRLELYNLKKDIGEKDNLAQKNPQRTKKMHELLKQWRESSKAPVPTELNPEYKPDA